MEPLDITSELPQLPIEFSVFILLILEPMNHQLLVLPVEFVKLLLLLVPRKQLPLLQVFRF